MKEKIRIIIADDHDMIRQTWKLLLQQDLQFEVIAECKSGEELLKLLPLIFPDIILLDINMNPVNGFEATKKIMKQWPDARIIGMSINDQPVYARNLLQLGARGYVTKDSSREEVSKAILSVMNGEKYVCEEIRKKMVPSLSPGEND